MAGEKEEKKIIDFLKESGGRVNQKDIPGSVMMSKAKVSRILNKLNETGAIVRKSLDGRTNEVVLGDYVTPYDYRDEVKSKKKHEPLKKETDEDFMKKITNFNKGDAKNGKEVKEEDVEEESVFDGIGKGSGIDEQAELSREREQMERLSDLNEKFRDLDGKLGGLDESVGILTQGLGEALKIQKANAKTSGMLTEAMLKLDERVVRIEKLLSKSAKG